MLDAQELTPLLQLLNVSVLLMLGVFQRGRYDMCLFAQFVHAPKATSIVVCSR